MSAIILKRLLTSDLVSSCSDLEDSDGGDVGVPALFFSSSFFVAFPLPIFLFPSIVGVIIMDNINSSSNTSVIMNEIQW